MRENKGITLISLIITIIVMLILASVIISSMDGSNSTTKTASSSNKIFELEEVQQAVLETYIKYKQTNNSDYLVGETCSESILLEYENEFGEIKFKDRTDGKINYNNYYMLNSKEDLNSLGIRNSEDYYIVNYQTGEVFNYTSKIDSNGKVLYVNAKE